MWSKEYLRIIEENFETIIDELYEPHFIDKIFDEHACEIYKDEFVISIAGNVEEDAKCDWIFKPN